MGRALAKPINSPRETASCVDSAHLRSRHRKNNHRLRDVLQFICETAVQEAMARRGPALAEGADGLLEGNPLRRGSEGTRILNVFVAHNDLIDEAWELIDHLRQISTSIANSAELVIPSRFPPRLDYERLEA